MYNTCSAPSGEELNYTHTPFPALKKEMVWSHYNLFALHGQLCSLNTHMIKSCLIIVISDSADSWSA